MPRLVRSSLLIVCLSLPVAVLLVTAQSAPPLFSSHDDGASGAPTEFVELAADEDEVRARIDANQSVTGDYTEEFKLAAIQEVERQQQQYPLHAAGAAAPSGVATWRSLGPTQAKYQTNGVTLQVSDSGRIRTILTHPTDPNVVYLLTSGGGLWKTTTFTHQHPLWEAKTDALLSTSGGSVAFGRTPDTLYLGIGDPFDVRALIAGVMVKSIDGGATWSPMASLSGAGSIRDVKVDTSGPADVVLVATNAGLFRSADGGATYSKIVATIGTRGIWSLARTAAGWLVSVQNDSGNFSGPGFLFHSEDQGATWSPIPNGGNGFSGAGRTTLAAATPGDPIVYAYAGNTAVHGAEQIPLRAAGGPFGGCIAHGLLTLSLAGGAFFHRLVRCDAKLGINYGCDRVRYPAVVRVGARVRGRADVQTAEPIGNDGVQMVMRMTVEIDGESRPGCVADFVVRYHF